MAWYDRGQNAIVGGVQGGTLGYTIGGPWGAAIGGGLGALQGLLSPTEEAELARKYSRGEIPPEVTRQIARQLANRYNALRRNTGADLARRGVLESTAAGRMMADISQQEREALAGALAGQTFNYQKLGMDLIAQRNKDLQAGIGSAASVLGHKMMLDHYRNQPTPGMPGFTPPPDDTPMPVVPGMQGSDRPHIGGRTGINTPGALSALSNVNSNFSRRQPVVRWG